MATQHGPTEEYRYAVEIGKTPAGWVHWIEGGHTTADLPVERVGDDRIVHRNSSEVSYEDITIYCGTGMSKSFYAWIKASFDREFTPQDGAIHVIDYDGNIASTWEWHHGFISEVRFPALDAASKDPANMTITITTPESTHTRAGTGKIGVSQYGFGQGRQKRWLLSHFRLSIPGCEEACRWINQIDALTVKRSIIRDQTGGVDIAMVESPHLVITLPGAHADQFYDWHRSLVSDGQNGPDQEKTGQLEYLTADGEMALFTLNFHGLGIFKMTSEKLEAGGESMRRIKVEMYCESIEFNYDNSVAYA